MRSPFGFGNAIGASEAEVEPDGKALVHAVATCALLRSDLVCPEPSSDA